MFYSEKPIISKNEDLLGRKKVASDLAKEIEYYKNKDSLTIGIVGKWGSGKTSFINMVLESFKGNNNYIVIKFNPWNISSRKQLISDFFLQLSNNIKKENESNEIIGTIGKTLGTLSKFFKPLGLIQPLSLLGTIGDITEKASGFINEYLEAEKEDLEILKGNINQELEDLDKKLLIVIDDIDRLCDEEIREIFQLVKSIADFKNTIYILSYDKEIVTKALDKTQQDKGEEYLEKIVQVPLVLPYVSKNELDKIFLDKLSNLINISDRDDFLYFQELYNNGLAENFQNLRDIERYVNVFSFGVELAREELNINDYIVLTLIKVFEPNLYEYIKNNKKYFFGVRFDENLDKNKTEILDELEEIYKKLKKIKKENIKKLIKIIFPKLKNIRYDEEFIDIWNKARRIAAPLYFESYFRLDFPEDEIKKSEIEKFRKFSTEEDLIKVFSINNKKKIKFLAIILEETEKLSDKKIITLLKYIFSIADELKYEGPKGTFAFMENPQYKITRIFYKILSNSNRNKYKIMEELFKYDKSSIQLLFSVLEMLNDSFLKKNLESEYGIEENQLTTLRDIAVIKILKESEKSEKIESGLLNILYTMKRLGSKEETKKVFKNYLKNKDLLIDFIKEFISTRTTEVNYSVEESSYLLKNYINDFYDYDEFVKLVDENFTNPNEEEAEVINQLKNAITREELQKD